MGAPSPTPLVIGSPETGGFNGGLWLGVSNNELKPNMSPEMYNYLVDDSGLTKRSGSLKDNATEIGSATGATGLHRHAGSKTYLKIGASVYELASTGASTERLAGLTAGDEVSFASWAGYCLLADGANLYAATTAAFSATAWLDETGASTAGWTLTPTPLALAVHKEHLWWIDHDSSRVGFTVRGYHNRVFEDTINANNYGSWVYCDADDGQYLTALARLPFADCLMAWKKGKSFFIEGDYDSTANTLAVRPGPPAGAYSQKAVVVCPDGFVRWFGPEGVWEYSQATGPRHISRPVDYELRKMTEANKLKAACGYWNRYFLISYVYGAGSANNRIFAYDTERGCWIQIRGWSIACFATFEDGSLRGARSNAGFVDHLFHGLDDNGTDIAAMWKTKYFNPGFGWIWALRYLRARTISTNMTIRYTGNAESGLVGSAIITRTPTTGGLVLGAWTLGTSVLTSLEAMGYFTFEDTPACGEEFREIQFSLEESSDVTHSIDYLEALIYPVRRDV
jgi:hypothetical protein